MQNFHKGNEDIDAFKKKKALLIIDIYKRVFFTE